MKDLFRQYIVTFLWLLGTVVLRLFYRIEARGAEDFPSRGALLVMGNHVSWLDWMLVQIPLKRRLRYMMDRGIYEWKALNWMFRLGQTIPVSAKASKGAFDEAVKAMDQGDALVIFPEGAITRSCEIEKFYRGFEIIASKTDSVSIMPFYIDGMCGSRWSYAPEEYSEKRTGLRRRVTIVYGKPLPASSRAETVREAVMKLKDSIAQ